MPIFGFIVLILALSFFSALFTGQIWLFVRLFGQPERVFYPSELRRLTSLGSASSQRELNRLAVAGLVDSQPIENLCRLKTNAQYLVIAKLVTLPRKILGTIPVLPDALVPLMPNQQGARVYGSGAKQTDTARSDIDVMLVGDNLLLVNVWACLAPVATQLGRKINPSCYSPEEFEHPLAESDSFGNLVLSQPTLALIGYMHEHVRI